MDVTIFLIVLFSLQVVCFLAGSKSSNQLENSDDYFLAGKGVRFFPLMMTFVATQVGGGLVLGSCEEAYQYGWAVLLYPLGACLGLALLATGIGKRMAQFDVSTVAQIFEVVYKSKFLKQAASSLSIISLFMVLVAQVIASKKFMLSLGVESEAVFIAFWAIVVVYTAVGGLRAVVATDAIQATFFIFSFLICFAFTFFNSNMTLVEIVNEGIKSENFDLGQEKLAGWLLMPLMFMVIEQDMGQRCFSAQTPKVVTKATAGAALLTMLICVIPVYFGILAKSMSLEITPGSSVLMNVITATTNPVIAAFVGCAILAAIISTADSLINAISSNLSQDFGIVSISVRSSQTLTAVIAILGLLFSYHFDNVVDLLILSYELSVCCLFVPVLAALFKKEGNLVSATLAILFGAIGYFSFRFLPLDFPKELLCVAVSCGGFYIGELIYALQLKQQRTPVAD